MTPEQQKEMWEWYQARRVQQLSYPVDDASRNALGPIGIKDQGAGTTALTQVYTDSDGDTVTAPRHFTASRVIDLGGGVQIEVPRLS